MKRSKSGYALVSIIVIGVFAVMFMLALAGMILSIVQSEAVSKQKSGLLDAAEVGLEYALKDLNDAYLAGDPSLSQFDVTEGNPEVTLSVPSTYILENGVSVKVKVRKLSNAVRPTANSFALLYAPQLEPLDGFSPSSTYASPTKSVIGSDYFRIVEATASKGIFSTSVRTVLSPELPQALSSHGSVPNDQLTSIFPNAGIFAVSQINISPNGSQLTIKGPDPQVQEKSEDHNGNTVAPYYDFNLTLQSNQGFSADATNGGARINGNVYVSNNPSGAPPNIVSLNSPSNQIDVNGRLLANNSSNNDVNAPTGSNFPNELDPNINVNAAADNVEFQGDPSITSRKSINDTNPSVNDAGLTPVELPPVPSSSANDLSQYLNSIGDYSDSSSTINLTHSLDSSGNEVSSFTTSNLFTDDVASVNIDPTNSSPTSIYIKGNNSTQAVNVDATKFVNTGDPSKLQLYYDGSSNVKLNVDGSTFNGLIFAPNANVNVVGNGTFQGAIVANKADINMTGTMNLIPDLGDLQNGNGGGGVPALQISSTGDASSVLVRGFRPATFQQVNAKLVP